MKKILAFALALTLILSLGVSAFAEGESPSKDSSSGTTSSALPVTKGLANDGSGMAVCNASDDVIDTVPSSKVVRIGVGQAGILAAESKDALIKAFGEVKSVTDKLVMYLFWLNTNGYTAPEGFKYYKLPFTCAGENVKVTVNGKDMEVVHEDGASYFAKLTELGVVCITCDK